MSAVRAPRRLAGALFACAISATAALAQAPDPQLARIDTLLGASRFTEARAALQRWSASAAAKQAGNDDAAHALLLRARLLSAADSALPLYLELALNYPSSRHAADALLRLGQGYTALGQHERAQGYLERLVRDYPAFDDRATALLWLGRARLARRRTTEACNTFRQALAVPGLRDDLRGMIEEEQARCTADAAATRPPTAQNAARAESAAARPAASGAYTIQVGAFRDAAGARSLAARLRARDIDARIVRIGDGSLVHVRAGRFAKSADAAELLRRVRTIVPDAVIASDAARERIITQ